MPKPLRVLFLEDRLSDVELMLFELRRANFDVTFEVVQEREEFHAALSPEVDIVLADFNLPQYNALDALHALANSGLDVPAIVVTGSLSDESAVQCMREGAADYLIKDRLARLASAVEHAVSERTSREEKRRAQAAERAAAQRLEAIFRSSRDAILLADDEARYVDANPAAEQLTGYAKSELLLMRIADLRSEPDEPTNGELWSSLLNSGEQTGEYTIRRKDGTTRLAEYQAVANIVPGVHLSVLRDITERKRTEEALFSAQKLESLGVLAGGVAHDFNNLLVAVLGNADLALEELTPESPAVDAVRQIKVAARRAADLARQMLALSGRGRFVVEAIDINALVDEMTHLLTASVSRGAVMRYNFARPIPAVEADATQLRQIVMNLVVNASDAIGSRSGTITISTGVMRVDRRYLTETFHAPELSEDEYVFIEVTDTGLGMDAATQKRIFDPFFTTKFTGRGLGLSAVLGILRAHGGAIKVYSEIGKGTTFKVLLRSSADKPQVAPGAADDSWHGSGLAIVVDDDESVRDVTARALERLGFEVQTANDGHEALTLFAKIGRGVTLVLLDMTMPRLDGEETFRELRRIRADVPVILMSGYSEQDATERFAGKGLAGFVQKPFEMSVLRGVVRNAVTVAKNGS